MKSTPWKIVTEHRASIASFLVQTTRLIHRSSGFQCVFVDLGESSALFTSSVVVPTFAYDHKGLAHTLEHLIFCGSRLHPEKGTLDQIANSFLSNGTNAYTAEDHTCYTFNTCHSEGLNRILPIFLDHIFFPTLGKDHFYTEVNHVVGEEGKLGGVVFCEMQARENSEADLCELVVKASLFGAESAYAMECGGKTGEIAEITLEEVVAFHKRFYHPQSCTLVVCGNLSLRMDSILDSIDGFLGSGIEAKSDLESLNGEVEAKRTFAGFCAEVQPNSAHSVCNSSAKKVNFPAAEEESVGSIVFGWRGPQMLQLAEIHALDLMLKFLNENASSLLQQTFVELKKPLATGIGHDIYSFIPTTGFTVSLSGIQKEDSGKIRSELIRILTSISNHLNMDAFRAFLTRTKEKLVFSFENAPLEFANQMIIPEVLANSYIEPNATVLGSNCEILQMIDTLAEKEKEFFVEVFSQYFNVDLMIEVQMVPSMEMNEVVKSELEKLALKKLQSCSSEELQQMKAAIEGSKFCTIPHISLVEQISANDFTSSTKTETVKVPFFGHVQTVKLNSQFTYFCLCIPLKGLPIELKKYLVLFQELFFQCEINVQLSFPNALPLGLMKYEQVVNVLSQKLISFSSSVGMDNDGFSCSYFSDYFVISCCSALEKQQEMFGIILQILNGLTFTATRIGTIASNLKNDLSESKREPEEMLDFLTARILQDCSPETLVKIHDSTAREKRLKVQNSPERERQANDSSFNDVNIGIFQQEKLLPQVIKNTELAIERLNELKKWILQSCESSTCLMQIGSSSEGEKALDSFLEQWKTAFPKALQNESSQFTYALPQQPAAFLSGKQFAYAMKCASTCHLTATLAIQMPFDQIASDPTRYYSLVCICQLLAATEGPLYSKIRGEGLAYRVGLSIAILNQQIIFTIGESVNPLGALKEFERIIQEIVKDLDSFFSHSNLNTAKSLVLYQIQENKNSPSALLTDKFKDFISRGAFRENVNVILSILTPSHLKAAFLEYFESFSQRATVFVVGSKDSLEGVDSFESLKDFYLP